MAPASPRLQAAETPAPASSTRAQEESAKRARVQMIERRLEVAKIGSETSYHLDEVKNEDDFNAWKFEDDR